MNTSDNKDNPERDIQSIQEKINSYILSNLLSVLSATSLLVGGIIFWLYFFDIQYFPDLNFSESVLFLLVAAITGVTTILITAFLIMIPYFIRWFFSLEQQNYSALSNDEKIYFEDELIWYFLSIFIVCSTLLLFHFENSWITWGSRFLVVFIIGIGHYKIYCKGVGVRKIKVDCKDNNIEKKRVTGKAHENMLVIWIFSAIMTLLILIFFIDPIVTQIDSNEHTPSEVALSLGIYIVIFFGILSFAWLHEKQKQYGLLCWATPFLTLFFIFFLTKNTFIPQFVMEKYKFGNFEVQQLLVDANGCKILKNLKLIPEKGRNKATCHLSNIKILSRLGRSFYLESTFLCKSPWLCNSLNFIIPRNHILSWSVAIPPKNNK